MKLKSLFLLSTMALLFAATSLRGTEANYQQMAGNIQLHKQGLQGAQPGEAVQVARLISLAKKVWDRSGKEAAKYVAYEVVTAGIDYVLSASSPGLTADLNKEKAMKLAKL
ncbi:hypothetical protein [Lewinella sp. IMCC34191]|uniref:hypothetical protein n=1 Tax=Lewinella sp. IMCC34191 TaxID=2259172 RepID=UPI000E275351|nr:hypothetical protein [Lewinella sp. IMCC34191]